MRLPKRSTGFLILLVFLGLLAHDGLNIPSAHAAVGYDVGTSTDSLALYNTNNRKIVYDGTYYWCFYWDGALWQYRYSMDCITWAGAGSMGWGEGYYGRNAGLCVEISGSTIYCITGHETYTIWFARGTISGTTISWAASVRVHNSGLYYNGLGFCRLSSGRLMIFYEQASNTIYAYYSDNEGVGWGTANAANVVTITSTTGGNCMVALASSGIGMAWLKDSTNGLWWIRYNQASGWSAPSQFASTTLAAGYSQLALTADGDTVWGVYLDNSNYIRLRYWTEAGAAWSGVESPYGTTAQAGCSPIVSVDSVTGVVYIFWGLSEKIYYITRQPDGTYSGRLTLVDETTDTLNEYYVTCALKANNFRVLVMYVAKSGSPYTVRVFALITVSVWATYYIAGVNNSGKLYVSVGGVSVAANMANGTSVQYANQTSLLLMGLPAYNFAFQGFNGSKLGVAWSNTSNPHTLQLYSNCSVWVWFFNASSGAFTFSGNASESDVLTGHSFYNNSTTIRYGSMVIGVGGGVNAFPVGLLMGFGCALPIGVGLSIMLLRRRRGGYGY